MNLTSLGSGRSTPPSVAAPARPRARAVGSAMPESRTIAQIANNEKSLDAVVLARALEGYTLPADIALDSNRASFRAADHELMGDEFLVGEVASRRPSDPFDVFTARVRIEGEKAEGPDAAPRVQARVPRLAGRGSSSICPGRRRSDLRLVTVRRNRPGGLRIDLVCPSLHARAHLDGRAEGRARRPPGGCRATSSSTTGCVDTVGY